MLELIMAWVCLGMGFVKENPLYLIASGVFAIAIQISGLRKGGGE